jgi:hypothetical protein
MTVDEGLMTVDGGLASYLTDHLAGATMGVELANKIAAEYAHTPAGAFLTGLARDVEADKASLEAVMGRLAIAPAPLKQAAAWISEKVSRAKLSETVTGTAELKRLLEFEVMSLGIEGKLAMWRALTHVAASRPELAEFDLPGLAQRAETQRAGLEGHRLTAAIAALT